MIQLSNTDAERVCRHLGEIFQSRKAKTRRRLERDKRDEDARFVTGENQ